jgi:hypothetical protein
MFGSAFRNIIRLRLVIITVKRVWFNVSSNQVSGYSYLISPICRCYLFLLRLRRRRRSRSITRAPFNSAHDSSTQKHPRRLLVSQRKELRRSSTGAAGGESLRNHPLRFRPSISGARAAPPTSPSPEQGAPPVQYASYLARAM